MGFKRCPGSTAFSQPKIELVRCPHCGDDAEVWSDEAEGKCARCGKPVCRTHTQSCVDWCKYARECLGEEAHKKYQDMKTRLRKDALLKAAEEHRVDERERAQARARVAFAEKILGRESAADPNVVIAAAALHTGAGPAPVSDAAQPPAAAEILHQLGYPEGFVKEVCAILSHLDKPGDVESLNFRIVYDADLLARDAAVSADSAPARFLTDAGKALARQKT